MSIAVRTAREVVELYNLELWNNRQFELADELIADNDDSPRGRRGAHPDAGAGASSGSPTPGQSSTTSGSTSTS